MQSLIKFTNFLMERNYALEHLEEFAELIEPIVHSDGWRGYQLKPLTEANRVTHRCKVLVHFTWHCRDYLLKILEEHGANNPGEVINGYIADSPVIQAVSYLANDHKHAGINPRIQRWGLDIAPRYGAPFVIGQMQDFPHTLKPTVMCWGDSLPGIEFAGRAGVGEEVFEFNNFEWKYSCNIEDKNGTPIGNVWGMCEMTFHTWLKVLTDHGIVV